MALTYEEHTDMLLVPWSTFKSFGSIPRSSDNVTVRYSDVMTEDPPPLIVFVSHRWDRPDLDPSVAHPDNEDGDKYTLLCKGLRTWELGIARNHTLYLWIDFACINQDDIIQKVAGIDSLLSYVERSDLLITPVVDPGHESWELEFTPAGLFKDYVAPSFEDYKSRAWTRLEFFAAAHVPHPGGPGKGIVPGREDRPHFVYGHKEVDIQQPPLVLPRLAFSLLREMDPADGNVTVEDDRDQINALMDVVKGSIEEPDLGYKGPRNSEGLEHGYGRMMYDNGDVYEGDYANGMKHGKGEYKFATGERYEGEWVNDMQHGHGNFYFAHGAWEENEYKNGKKNGPGVYHWPNGDYRCVSFVDGWNHGPAEYHFVNGRVKHEVWEHGRQIK